MTERQYHGKDEKDVQKQEEKGSEEKSWEEKWRRDPLGSIVGAAFLMWAGVVLLASNLGYLDTFTELLAGLSSQVFCSS